MKLKLYSYLSVGIVCGWCLGGYQTVQAIPPPQSNQESRSLQPFNVGDKFTASGRMGGPARNREIQHINMVEGWKINPHSSPVCIQVVYKPGKNGWAGVYWQNKPDNWGKKPGENLKTAGYQKLTFWARGEKGTEVVEFKAGGIEGKTHKDSFEASTGKITLGAEWQQYIMDLKDKDLSMVIGGFAWVATESTNPEGLTFYLDDILYE